jgi:hypothetical protein
MLGEVKSKFSLVVKQIKIKQVKLELSTKISKNIIQSCKGRFLDQYLYLKMWRQT